MISPTRWAALVILVAVMTAAVRSAPAQSVSRPERVRNAGNLVVAVGGDVLPESNWSAPVDAARLLSSMRVEFARADLVFVNLEEPITSSDAVTSGKNAEEVKAEIDYVLHARNGSIPVMIKRSGVGLVGLANNHMMDYAEPGLLETLGAFRSAELPVVGAGLKREAEGPYIFAKKGRRVAFLAFSDVVPPRSRATSHRQGIASSKNTRDLIGAIRRARQQADFVVLMIHWGGQGSHLITPRQRQLAQIVAQAGCDAVVGMHPHVLQGIEYVGSTPVFYSIGNFAFPAGRADHRESLLVKLVLSGNRLDRVELVPIEVSRAGAPRSAKKLRREEILDHLDTYCEMFNTTVRSGKLERAAEREALVYDSPERARRTVEKPAPKSDSDARRALLE
jgi:poly-gamma-glutamate capsule biosynthesis protein CapA/YwtB (metallophosphatase superfamily)